MSNLIHALNWRYATKVFDKTKKIPTEDMEIILEATRLSPSSYGLQPFKLIVVESQDIKDQLFEHSYGQAQMKDAACVLVYACMTKFDENEVEKMVDLMAKTREVEKSSLQLMKDRIMQKFDIMSSEQVTLWASQQAYIAVGNTMTVLASMGYDGCPMEGIVKSEFDKILGLEKLNLKTVIALPIGIRHYSDAYIQRKKVRRDQEDFIIRF